MKFTTLFRKLWIFIAPLLLSPLLFFGKELRCVFAIMLMSAYWMTECVPLAITSLLPIFLFPFLDIQNADDVSSQYMNDTTVLLMITLFMAIAVEETGLHRRLALKMLTKVGTRPGFLLFGFMLITTFISFFVSDSATTAMMIPIALAILEAMTGAPAKNTSATIADHLRLKELSKKQRGFCKAMILVCAHASLIGGTAILTSTAPNLIFRNELNRRYPNEPKVTMTYVKWLQFSLPPMFGYLIASYLIVMTVFIGPFSLFDCFRAPSEEEAHASKEVERSVKEAYKNLGSISFSEISVLFWFIVLIVSWIFREPGFMTGWADLIYGKEKSERFKDSTVGILIVFILFAWPKDFNIRSRNRKIADIEMETKGKTKGKASEEMKIVRRSEAILTWPVVQRRMSWSVLLLIGAGFAISEGVKSSGLSQWLACEVSAFKHLDEMVIQAAITAIIVFTTEFMSNGATANIFVPIVQTVAVSLHLHPLYLGIPSAIAPSFAFMLPMATPPNALVYDTHVVGFFEMLLVGTLLNCVCISITILSMNTWTYWLFDLGYVPDSVLLINNATLNC